MMLGRAEHRGLISGALLRHGLPSSSEDFGPQQLPDEDSSATHRRQIGHRPYFTFLKLCWSLPTTTVAGVMDTPHSD